MFPFSDVTAPASGFIPNLMEVTHNVLCVGGGRKRSNHKIQKYKNKNKILDNF